MTLLFVLRLCCARPMSSNNSFPQGEPGDESDDLDLAILSNRITRTSERIQNESIAQETPQEDDDEPDWVREFSQSLPNEQQRREALASQFDEDDDESVIDLIPDDPGPSQTKPSLASDAQQSQKANQKKPPLKRQRNSSAPSNRMPLVVSSKLDESLVLLQSTDKALDLSGDVGAVGRVKLQQGRLYLDIKGTVYKANTIPCSTACIVSVADDEAKISAVLDEAVTLVSDRNLFASSEIVIHGDLQEEKEDSERDEAQQDAEPTSKKRKLVEKSEKGKGKASQKPRSSSKGSRKKN